MDFTDDFDFMGDEDFGLAKSFRTASVFQVAPQLNTKAQTAFDASDDPHSEQMMNTEVRSDGFNFTLAPSPDQVQFQRQLKTMAPKMKDFAKGTTTLAFEFKEGVLVAVDARATQGSFISSNNSLVLPIFWSSF